MLKKMISVLLVITMMASIVPFSVLQAYAAEKEVSAVSENETPDHEHVFVGTVTKPTCTEKGYTTFSCAKCDESYIEDYTDPLGHDYVEGVCSRCGEEDPSVIIRGTCGDHVSWVLNTSSRVLSISGTGEMKNYDNGDYPKWYSRRASIKTVIISDGITSIGDWMFFECNELTSVSIPDSVTRIGNCVFYYCSSLSSIHIPDSVTEIGEHAFYDSAVSKISIPDKIENVGTDAFYNCKNLQFSNYDNAKYLGNESNPYLVLIESVSEGISSCEIHPDTRVIAGNAFYYNQSLTAISLPEGAVGIGDYAFNCCKSLTTISVPNTLKSIGSYAFYYTPNMQYNSYENGNYIGNEDNPYVVLMKANHTGISSCTIHPDTKVILDQAFSECSSLSSITIPDGITRIPDYAFSRCSALRSIEIPNTVTSIGYSAFGGCQSLNSIPIPDSVTIIGENAFSWCSSLSSVTIPDSVTLIERGAFIWCSNLTSVKLSNNITCIEDSTFSQCTSLESVTIPDGVLSIELGAFSECTSLISVTIPDSVTSIDSLAFDSCSSLKEVSIPDSVTYLGYEVFSRCTKLEKVKLPATSVSIGNAMFLECSSLKSIDIPEGITSIDGQAFMASGITEIIIPSTVTSIGVAPFESCENLTSITVAPENKVYHSVNNCLIQTNTKTLVTACDNSQIPADGSVTTIGSYAFYHCSWLTSVFIPVSVTYVGFWAFYGCGNLAEVYYEGSEEQWNNIYFDRSKNSIDNATINYYFVPNVLSLTAVVTDPSIADPNEKEIKSGYTIKWYEKDSGALIGTGNKIVGIEEDKEYRYEIILGEELSYLYKQPTIQDVVTEEDSDTVSIPLDRLPVITVSGKVTAKEDDSSLNNASVTFRQIFNEKYEKETVVNVNDNGEFSTEIKNSPAEVMITANGYYSRTKTVFAVDGQKTVNLGTIALVKLPENKITIQLTKLSAVREGDEQQATQILSANGLTFSLYNQTQNRAINGFTVQYPNIILNDSEVNAGDTLLINATDNNEQMTATQQTVKLDSQKIASCSVEFTENGRFTISAITGNDDNTLMLFDQNGKHIRSESISSNYESNPLTEGEYTALLIKKTDLLRSVSELSKLAEFGLAENTDYVVKRFNITNGTVTELGEIAVPSFDESKLYYTVADSTLFTANASSVSVGRYVIMRCAYKIDDKHRSSNESVTIELPDGVSFVTRSLTLNGRAKVYSIEGNKVTVSTKNNEGVIRFYVTATNKGQKNINASLTFMQGSSAVIQPIGTASFTAEAGKMVIPEKTSQKSVLATGTTMANADITIYDNGIEAGNTKSNAAGSWRLKIDLIKPYSFSYHEIYAKIENSNIDNAIYTDSQILVYDKNYIEVSKVTMINNSTQVVFDFLNPSAVTPSYSVIPSKLNFTFKVEFTGGDDTVLSDVYVVTTNNGVDETFIPMAYDQATKMWIGTHDYCNSSQIPELVKVEYSDIYSLDNTIDTELSNWMNEEISEIMSNNGDFDIDSFLKDECKLTVIESSKEKTIYSLQFSYEDSYEEVFIGQEKEELVSISDVIDDTYFKGVTVSGFSIYTKLIFNEDLFGIVIVNTETNETEKIVISFSLEALKAVENNSTKTLPLVPVSANGLVDVVKYQELEKLKNDLIWAVSAYEEISYSVNKILVKIEHLIRVINSKCFDNRYQSLGNVLKLIEQWKEMAEYGLDALWEVPHREVMLIIEINDSCLSESEKTKLISDVRWWASFAPMVQLGQKTLESFFSLSSLLNVLSLKMKELDIDINVDLFETQMPIFEQEYGTPMTMAFLKSSFIKLLDRFNNAVFGPYKTAVNAIFEPFNNIPDAIERIISNTCDSPPYPYPKSDHSSPDYSIKPIVDPSGYVYEAVPSNRIEGVKAEAYYYDYAVDEFGVPEDQKSDILWDAENYDQVNPLYTDANGQYAWDVPAGQWLVKFSKDGYYDMETKSLSIVDDDGYLPVPPPQTEVNVGMVSKSAPTVKSISVFEEEIRIEFSQYMQIDSVNSNTVTVKMNGKTVNGTITPVNAEYDYEQEHQYASIFVFLPATAIFGKINVTVNSAVNYAGTKMTSSFTESNQVAVKPESLVVKSEISVAYNSGALLEIDVLPKEAGAGLTLVVSSSSPSIVGIANSNIVTDENGHANIMLLGNLPGEGEITVSLNGTDITKTVKASVAGVVPVNDRCEKVTANIKSGNTLESGTLIELSTTTEGAEIYYTLDGTCPCTTDSPSRIKYTEPICITEDTFIIAYAVKDGMQESYTAGFNYFVPAPVVDKLLGDVDGDGTVTIIDATYIQRQLASIPIPFDFNDAIADTDEDGSVTILDATYIQRWLASLPSNDNIGKPIV